MALGRPIKSVFSTQSIHEAHRVSRDTKSKYGEREMLSETTERRIINGARYFRSLKPSDFVIMGTPSPTKWRELMKYCDMILEENEQVEVLNK